MVFSSTAWAATNPVHWRGTIVEEQGACSFLIIEIDRKEEEAEYALLEWYGEAHPSKGDVVWGAFNYGPEVVHILGSGVRLDIWLEEYYLSYGDALEDFFERCS